MSNNQKFILNTAVEFFAASLSSSDNELAVNHFFENEELSLLAVTCQDSVLDISYELPRNEAKCLLFYKADGSSLGLLTLEGGLAKSVYNSVNRIFSGSAAENSDFSPTIAEILDTLKSNLVVQLGIADTGITTIKDEIVFWNQKHAHAATKSDREAAESFSAALEHIQERLAMETNLPGMDDFTDFIHNALDEIWKLPYQFPQNRMLGILKVVSGHVVKFCVTYTKTVDVWNLDSLTVNSCLVEVKDVVDDWLQVCDSLTRLFWPNYGQHAWTGEPFIPENCQKFKGRVDEISKMRDANKQIVALFADDKYFNRLATRLSSAFETINCFDISLYGQKRWADAKRNLEPVFEEVDDKIAEKLQSQILAQLQNPRQLIHLFVKYRNVIERRAICQALLAEREHLMDAVQSLIRDLKLSLAESNHEESSGSPVIAEAKFLKIVDHEVKQISDIAEAMLSDRSGYDALKKDLDSLAEELKSLMRVNYESWYERSSSAIRSGDLTLDDNDPVVMFDSSERQLMKVTFKPKLITFCHEVRGFRNLGYSVPTDFQKAAIHAMKFVSLARNLQHISTVHNTIGDRMIPCQRPIMLKNAMELAKLVRSETVSWNNQESVGHYVNVLQKCVNHLSRDNSYLIGLHEEAKKIVVKLMNTSLTKRSHVWKEEMRNLRDIVVTLEKKGYTNLDPFKLHWDHQLYKVLEYQYVMGLMDDGQRLPDINVDIVFRQQLLQFRPPLEELRTRYFTQLRKFLEKPLGFRGLSDKSHLFKVMVELNRRHFKTLYEKADRIMQELEEVKDVWLPWVALGCIDAEQLCSIHLTSWQLWDKNFKACKHFSQQIAKIQDIETRVDCFVVNLSPLRSDIEFISRRYWEALSITLRASILTDINQLQDYLTSALQVLRHIPQDESKIIEASAKYEKIVLDLPKMAEVLKTVQEKDTCLAGWCKERVSSLVSTQSQWEQLQPLIENHQSLLQGRLDIFKNEVLNKVFTLGEESEKFLIRWQATLQELESNDEADVNIFKDRLQQWDVILERKTQMMAEADQFNVEIPEETRHLLAGIEQSINVQKGQWNQFANFANDFDTIHCEEWSVYRRRPYIFTDLLTKWEATCRDSAGASTARISNRLNKYRSVQPILTILQSDALTEKQWIKIFQLLNLPPKPYYDILLGDVLQNIAGLVENTVEIQTIVKEAASEQIVRQAISELEQWSVTATLKTVQHTDSRGNSVTIIKDFQEVLNKIGDNQSLLQAAKVSVAFEAFSDQAEIWESKLNQLDFILTNMNTIQRKWIYLEPIFSAGTLKSEEAVFSRIDKDFRYIMREIFQDPRVMSLIRINNVQNVIDALLNQLSRCQNTLTSYVTNKRNAFARFYFLSDDDLLEILGQITKEPNVIQKHIKKLFPGVHQLKLVDRGDQKIVSEILSAEGDSVKLTNEITIAPPVEDWLNQLVTVIKKTLQHLTKQCCQTQIITLEHVQLYPMQVFCIANSVIFTRTTEKAISSMALPECQKNLKTEIAKYAKALHQTKNKLLQIKIRALLFDMVYQSNTLQYLIDHNVTNSKDWFWVSQLRFTLNKQDVVTVRMVYAEFDYSYEYLGNFTKLVYTSLTHNCYLTLMQAMHLGMGGNPFGPAGTGKTECVKALGAMLGRLVFVFNCSENVDSDAMSLILSGLARCGAWGCFDEFNRLQDTTLSAISMMIQPLMSALKEKASDFYIQQGDKIPLNPDCNIFVTLNPASEEYGGRQKLPTNLQALFRPIVMQQPEPESIAKVILFVEGFERAEELGRKIVELFQLAEKMLSPQKHYDWGLRELKTVLMACGNSLYDNKDESDPKNELTLAVNVIRTNTMSKLTLADYKRFDILISNVFTDVQAASVSNSELRNKIQATFTTLGYKVNDRQTQKCLELYEQLMKRMGVVVLGPPSSGKSTIITILRETLIAIGKTIRNYVISPKSMSRVQLLGYLDQDTRQWHDGVMTNTAIAVSMEPMDISSWIVCDGDIDPEWIEALNSVLDDNHLLTLPSGWRIQFQDNVNFIFETHDLTHASPATISRMGIIYVSAEDLDNNLVLNAWADKQTDAAMIRQWTDDYLKTFVAQKSERQKFLSDIPTKVLLQNPLSLLEEAKSKDEFCVSVMRGVACLMNTEHRNEMANLFFEFANVYVTDPKRAELAFFNGFRGNMEFYETDERNFGPLVVTASAKFNIDVLKSFLATKGKLMFLMVGPSGSGKSLILQHVTADLPGYQLLTINCSAHLIAQHVIYALKQHCLVVSGIRGKEFKPKLSRLVLYMKNLDLCAIDSYGTCEVVEVLLQLYHRNGFYSDTLEWISVSGLQICGSVSTLDKHSLSARFLYASKILTIDYPSSVEMLKIIESFFQELLTSFKNGTDFKVQRLALAVTDFFKALQENFPQDVSRHYKFTPKHIEQWVKALANYPQEDFQDAMVYECNRIFRDRLMTFKEKEKFDEMLTRSFRGVINANGVCFFVPSTSKSPELALFPVENWNNMVQRNVSICNSEYLAINMPIQNEQLDSIAQLCRCLSRPETNILIVGQSGSGRTEAVAIACAILNIKLLTPTPIENYGINDFYNDLRPAMQAAASEDETVVFMVDHSWIKYSTSFLGPIEAILQGSEIPDLFGDELEAIASNLKSQAQLEGYQESMISYFLKKVKANLHLALVLESTDEGLQDLFKQYPVLYNNTEIVWTSTMSSEYLRTLPFVMLEQMNAGEAHKPQLDETLFLSALNNCKVWRDSPKRNIHLVYAFNHIQKTLYNKHRLHFNKLKVGVDRLAVTHSTVASLRQEAESKELELGEKRQLADQALQMISNTMKNANNQKTDLLSLKAQTEESSQKLFVRKKAIEAELALVEPLLKEASAAVGQIKTEALSEIRSLRAPPEIIRDILEGVLRLMGIRDTSWNSMKTFLAKRGVKEDIRSLDPSQITPENCASVEKLLRTKADSFELKNAKRASAAAAPLTQWVKANVTYAKVMQSIKPLEREQNELKRNLESAETEMSMLSTGLDDVNARVKQLSDQLNLYTQEAAVLEIKLEEARKVLRSAEVLVTKLDSEYTNWSQELEELQTKIDRIQLEGFLSALCVTHFVDQGVADRIESLKQVCSELELPTFTIATHMLTEQDQLVWQNMGLTPDGQSFENAAILKQQLELPFAVSPIPVVLDPTGHTLKWLQNFLKSTARTFETVSQNQEKFTYNLELAIRFGKILLVLDPFPLAPPLLPVVLGKIVCRFNKCLIPVGNKLLDLHDDFKIVLVTSHDKLQLPGYSNASLVKIPFTITMIGLTDQLMSKCISRRQPELEQKRVELLQNESSLFEEKVKLQDQLLEELSSAQGNILQNEKLIATLNHIKESTMSIETSLGESVRVRQQLTKDFEKFKEICESSASLFIGINRTHTLDIATFLDLFVRVIGDERNMSFKDAFRTLVKLVFTSLSRSILRSEQIALALNVAKQAYANEILDREWDLFVFNFVGSTDGVSDISLYSWMKKEAVPKIQTLSLQHPQLFEKLQLNNGGVWNAYMKTPKAGSDLPMQLTEFQKILVAQLFRPDLMINTIIQAMEKILGFNFLSLAQPSIKQISESGSSAEPILLLSTAGNDPSLEVRDYAAHILGKDRLVEIAMRKGLEQTTISKIRDAAKAGKWVCIKNVHLMTHWLPRLDSELKSLPLNGSFRLWLTADVNKNFTGLARCHKYVFEPPTGVKFKLWKLLEQYRGLMTQKRDVKTVKLCMGLLILHSIVQERRTYNPQGWCKWYDFSDSDLRTAFDLVSMVLAGNSTQIDWLFLRELTKVIVYGGKIDNSHDFQKLALLNADFFDAKVLSARWNPFSVPVTIPNSANLDDYVAAVEKLPDMDSPQLYGLPASTTVQKDLIFCRNLLRTLRAKSLNDDSGLDLERRLKPILTMWRKLAANNAIQTVYKQNVSAESRLDIANPWAMYNLSELSTASKLYQIIHRDLSDVHAALRSTSARSPRENELLLALCENQTPMTWRTFWKGPRVATDFIKNVTQRGAAIEKRCQESNISECIKSANLADFFSVDGFLSVIKLAKARASRLSTSDLTQLITMFVSEDVAIPTNSVKISPLHIDCGSFRNDKLSTESDPTQQHLTSHLLLTHDTTAGWKVPPNCVPIPLYMNITREQFVCDVQAPTSVSNMSELIYAGTAFYIN